MDASSPAQDKGLDRPGRKIFSRGATVSISGRLLVAGARRIRMIHTFISTDYQVLKRRFTSIMQGIHDFGEPITYGT